MTEEIKTEEAPVCFLCYDDDSSLPFVTPHPCKCSGSTRVHVECLVTVLKSYKRCGACNTKYEYRRPKIMRNGLELIITYYKPLVQEMTPVKKEEFTISAPGVKHGEYILFDHFGRIIKTCNYQDNILHGVCTEYYNSDTLHKKSSIHYVNGKKEGEFKTYYLNGALEIDASFHDNKLHGKYNRFYANGVPMIECTYDNGLKHGPCTHYYPNGNVQIYSDYNMDKLEGDYYSYKKDGTTNSHKVFETIV